MAPPAPADRKRRRYSVGLASNTGVLPLDTLFEILLRFDAKELCRFRLVCRTWRSLLSDPDFIAAHTAQHPDPLILLRYHHTEQKDGGVICDMMDMSGRVIKRISRTDDYEGQFERVMSTHRDVICIASAVGTSCRLLNPATGIEHVLPDGLAEEHAEFDNRESWHYKKPFVTFGQVPSTGAYKVFRVLETLIGQYRLYEIFSLDGSDHARWRVKNAPVHTELNLQKHAVVDGVMYFVALARGPEQGGDSFRRCIAPLDLETEEWTETLQGPRIGDDHMARLFSSATISMASTNGCLIVAAHHVDSSLDLWFLMDLKKDLWVKKHSICPPLVSVSSLFLLNDGVIVLQSLPRVHWQVLIRVYDTKTCTYTDVAQIGPMEGEVSFYGQSLLSLPDGGSCNK